MPRVRPAVRVPRPHRRSAARRVDARGLPDPNKPHYHCGFLSPAAAPALPNLSARSRLRPTQGPIVHEKRRDTRYHPGTPIEICVHGPRGMLMAPLRDLSASGLMLLVPDATMPALRIGDTVGGELPLPDGPQSWQGSVVHLSPYARRIGLGIVADAAARTALQRSARWLAELPETGALRLERSGQQQSLSIIGRLSFDMNRDFLSLVRSRGVDQIDLSRCGGTDSAGIGMLCIARDAGIPMHGARDSVASLLQIAGIAAAGPRRLH